MTVTDTPDQFIDFISNLDGIVAIKRLRITPQTKTEEIAVVLSGIRRITDAGVKSNLDIDTEALDKIAQSISANIKGKGIGALDAAILKGSVKGAVGSGSPAAEKEALRYLASSVLSDLKMPSYITESYLIKLYPDLKSMVKIKSKKSKKGKEIEE